MKVYRINLGDEPSKTVWTEGGHTVSLETCRPNKWNMNKMSPQMYEKTKLAVKETREEGGRIPPIAVRPWPGKKRILQIIDGEHRWRMFKDLGYPEIEVDVSYLSTKRAMLMTPQMNYDRGDPDMEKYPQYLANMIKMFDDVDAKYLAERLPDSEDEIKSYLNSIDFELETISIAADDDEVGVEPLTRDASDSDALLDLKFTVRQGAGEVIEKELARLVGHLGGGKNTRGRALEVMAVLSSQTPDGSIDAQMEDEEGQTISTKLTYRNRKKKIKGD